MTRTIEYPCPECGHDGPHPVVEEDGGLVTFECTSCYTEVGVREEQQQ